jgi:hypothetical protein
MYHSPPAFARVAFRAHLGEVPRSTSSTTYASEIVAFGRYFEIVTLERKGKTFLLGRNKESGDMS